MVSMAVGGGSDVDVEKANGYCEVKNIDKGIKQALTNASTKGAPNKNFLAWTS